jgi:penicillin-binding protein 1B
MTSTTKRHWSLPRKVLYVALGLAAAAALALLSWVVYLDGVVQHEFKGRLWSIPARVYAAPTDLYVGAAVTADDLDTELRRLHYRAGDPAIGPGNYRRRGGDFDINTRRVRFVDGLREPVRVRVRAGGEGISGIESVDGTELPLFQLDPLLIGSVFPVHGEDRIVLTPNDVPDALVKYLKTIEDRRFDEHHGVDARSILRALWADLRAGQMVQGGSTLTQQLVKNYFLSDERTFGRKLKEAIMAMRLEAHYTKEEILIAYLNEVDLGQDGERAIHGFGLGSEYYFGKPIDELEPAEMALLVGLVKGPSWYDPLKHPDRARTRRNLVLKELADAGVIDQTTFSRATTQALGLRPAGAGYVPAFLDLVRRHLKRDYSESDLAAAGLSIYTTLDPHAQGAAERAVTTQLKRLDTIARNRSKGAALEAAMIIAEPTSGQVLAVVGGRDTRFLGFNRALDARRSIGSLVKPAVYLTALEGGRYNAATILQDAPLELKLPDGQVWAPQNYTHEIFGAVPMVRALSESMNLATVRLGLDLGLPAVADTLQKLGLERRPALNPSMLLGTVEMTPLEVVQIYTALANGGFQSRLRSVQAVLDESGKPLKSFKLEVTPAASPAAVYAVSRMMTQVTERGTGRAVGARLHIVLPAKTGTSSDLRDSWFAGFTGSHVAVAWVGYDDNRPTGLTGATGALPVWLDAMAELHLKAWQPDPPTEVEDRWIEFSTGLATEPRCSGDAVLVGIPRGTVLPTKSGCGQPASENVVDRVKSWLQKTLH